MIISDGVTDLNQALVTVGLAFGTVGAKFVVVTPIVWVALGDISDIWVAKNDPANIWIEKGDPST